MVTPGCLAVRLSLVTAHHEADGSIHPRRGTCWDSGTEGQGAEQVWTLSRSVKEWIKESYPEGRRRQEGPVDGCLQCGPGWDLVRCSEQASRSWEVAGSQLQPSQRWKRFRPACGSPSACPDPRESWVWRRCSHCPLERPSGARAMFFLWRPSREGSAKALSAVLLIRTSVPWNHPLPFL